MAAIRGNSGVLQLEATVVAQITSFTLDTTQDTAETSAMGSTSRTYISTMQSYSGSADFILEGGSETAQHDAIAALEVFSDDGEPAAILLYPEGDRTGDSPPVYGDIEISGNVIVTGYSITGSFDGVVTGSLTFQGTGDLTMGVTAA